MLSQVSPVLDQYKGQLCHESTDFSASAGGSCPASPSTDLSTRTAHDDGRVELLLQLTGVLPVSIGAATYHCPIALWLPLDFPTKPPMVFVIPSATLAVKSGPNVDPSGRVSVPYLDNWTRKGEVSWQSGPHSAEYRADHRAGLLITVLDQRLPHSHVLGSISRRHSSAAADPGSRTPAS